jgi:ABC-2 type transport system permease protein
MSAFPAFQALMRTDITLYFSSRRALVMNVVAPIAIAAFFGYVFSPQQQKAPHVAVAVVDLDGSTLSKSVVDALSADASLDVRVASASEANTLVTNGKISAAIILPEKFGAMASSALFAAHDKPSITLIEDPSKAMEVSLVQWLLMQHAMQTVTSAAFSGGGMSTEMVSGWRRDLAAPDNTLPVESRSALAGLFDSLEKVQSQRAKQPATAAATTGNSGGMSQPFVLQKKSMTGGSEKQYNGYAHSFAGMSVQFILFMGVDLGVALLLARRLGLWKRLRAAPLSRATLLGSRMASGTIIAATLLALIFAAAIAFFGVRIYGSVPGFVAIGLAFSVMTATFGLFIAAVGKTPEATRGLAILATLIMVMLGGAWVPSFIFPQWLQTVSLAVPTRWAVDGFDAMTWRGLGFEAAIAPTAVLLGFAALFALLALWRFDWDE